MKKLLTIIFIFLFLIAGCFGYYNYKKNKKNRYNVSVNIKQGTTPKSVFKKLKIDDSLVFKLFLKYEKDQGKKIKAGYYEFKGEYSYLDILDDLENGRVKYTVLTIPEGYSIKEIGKLLENKGIGNEEGLKKALSEIKDFPYPTPNGNFEGYLYPETYYLSVVTSEKEVVNGMLKQFLKKFPPSEYPDKEKFYKELIMASIVDREAQKEDEKPIIASVFYNRLKKGMKLGSDATVNYLYGYTKRKMYYKDLKIDSPYNTYMYKGLPPAPISNPDYKSMMAAMNPAKTDYLFFVATGEGRHTFTKTYKEHLEVQKK